MITRDTRWENVWAYVGPPQGYIDDGEGHEDFPGNWIEFFIEVELDGHNFWSIQRIHKEDLDVSNFDTYKFLLDEMVGLVDDRLKEDGYDRDAD